VCHGSVSRAKSPTVSIGAEVTPLRGDFDAQSHCSQSSGTRLHSVFANRYSPFSRAVTLLELLVVIAILSLLIAVLLPSLAGARREAKAAVCATRLRELGRALHLYANDFDGRLMPLAYWSFEQIGDGPVNYWWGTDESTGVDFTRGFLHRYLAADAHASTVFECPEQPWGTYDPQGTSQSPTSTYGYNGYYLSPAHTPGWAFSVGDRPWLNVGKVRDAAQVFAFADAAIDLGGERPRNNALLDPPMLYQSAGVWSTNDYPTTAFRHDRRMQAAHVDGHVSPYAMQAGQITSSRFRIGSVGREPGPHYVPNWREW